MMNDQIKEIKDIISKIESMGFTKSAEDLLRLFNLPDEDFIEGDLRLKLDSVIGYQNYLLNGNYFEKEPLISITPNGTVSANWFLANSTGNVIINFINKNIGNWGFYIIKKEKEENEGGKSLINEINKEFIKYNVNKK